jgi:hypothetical protein
VSWEGGEWYTLTLAPDGSGTFDITSATLETTIVGGPEGIFYVPPGSPLFDAFDSVLVAEWSAGNIVAYSLDANGDPEPLSRTLFITGLEGARGSGGRSAHGRLPLLHLRRRRPGNRGTGFCAPAASGRPGHAAPAGPGPRIGSPRSETPGLELLLLPPSLADWVPENHLARFVSDVVAKAALKAEARALAEGKDPAQSVPPPKAQRNFTDPESKIQQTSDGFIQGYNARRSRARSRAR